MDCHESRLLIDERVHGSLSGDLAANLDAHLRGCGECRDDLRQLEKTRAMLHTARDIHAPENTMRNTWLAIQNATAANSGVAMARSMPKPHAPISLTRWKKVAVASLMVAAVFIVAMQLGTMQERHEWLTAGAAQTPIRIPLVTGGPAYAEGEEVYRRTVEDKKYARGPVGEDDGRHEVALAAKDNTIRQQESLVAQERNEADGLAEQNKALTAHNEEYLVLQPPNAPVMPVEAPQKLGDLPGLTDDQKAFILGKRPEYPALSNPNIRMSNSWFGPMSFNLFNNTQANPTETSRTKGDPEKAIDTPPKETKADAKLKIIKTGELTLEIKNYTDSTRAVEALVTKFQAQIADSRTSDLSGAAKRGDIVIRVVPERFEELFGELKKLGTVLQDRAGAADITAQYVDTEARIKNMRVEEERLQELVKSKTYLDKIQSLLEVERELTRVRGEIEGMEGQMRVWQEQIGLSTIRLTLQEPARAVPTGSLSVEVANLSEAKKALDAALTNAGAQLLNGQTNKRSDGTLMGTYALRAKFGRFAEVAAAIKGLGRVQDEKIVNQPFGSGVPDGAQDVPCDIALVLFERGIQLPTESLQIEVGALPEAIAKLDVALAAAQATVVSNQTQRQNNGVSTAQISLRVRAGNFAALVDALPSLGRIAHRTVGGESGKIQGGAADVPCTVELQLFEQPKEVPGGAITLEVTEFVEARDRLTALTKEQGLHVSEADSRQRSDGSWTGAFKLSVKAEKMDAVIGQLEKLGRVKSRDVKGVGLGELSRVDPNVVGEIAVTIQEKPTIAPQEEGSFRMLMRDTFGGFLTSMGYLIRGLGMMLPWLAVIAVLFGLIWRFTRGKKS